jgi:hypothetical protein
MKLITLPRTMLAGAVATVCLFANDRILLSDDMRMVSSAEAIIGRPVTPMSYAGVARRTTRRAVAAGAAVGAAAAPVVVAPAPVVVAPGPGCVQVVNAYGQIVWRCP